MKNFVILSVLAACIGIFSFGLAHAQISQYQGDVGLVQGVADKNCTNVKINGAITPFILELVFDKTPLSTITESHLGTGNPFSQKSDQLYVFYANDVDQYNIKVNLNYPVLAKHGIVLRYTGQNSVMQEDINYFGTNFCRTFDITTVAPVHIQTREEILGKDILDVPKTLQQLVDAQTYNTQVTKNQFDSTNVLVYVMVGLFIIALIMMFANRGQSRKMKTEYAANKKVLADLQTSTKNTISEIKEEQHGVVEKWEKLFNSLGGLLVEFKNTMQMTIGERQRVESILKEIEEAKKVPEKKKSKLMQFADKYVKWDKFSLLKRIAEIKEKMDEESRIEKEVIQKELNKREQSEKNSVIDADNISAMIDEKIDVKKMSDDQLIEFYRKYYSSDNLEEKALGLAAYDEYTNRRKPKEKQV